MQKDVEGNKTRTLERKSQWIQVRLEQLSFNEMTGNLQFYLAIFNSSADYLQSPSERFGFILWYGIGVSCNNTRSVEESKQSTLLER